jgi:hypothetical protein
MIYISNDYISGTIMEPDQKRLDLLAGPEDGNMESRGCIDV